MVITPQFDYAAPFVDGIAVVNIGEKWGFINTEGEYILPLQFDQAESFSEGSHPSARTANGVSLTATARP